MVMDMSVDLIGATVELEQPLGAGLRTVAPAFSSPIRAPTARPG
jgi:hypothetical protein